jgi:hypothetical protein
VRGVLRCPLTEWGARGSGIMCVLHGDRCTMLLMVSSEVERVLLENVLDALDDLYDQRERAAWWAERLLVATAVALQGSQWEGPMSEAAQALGRIRRDAADVDGAYTSALAATDDLRHLVAGQL